jgi:hypothetical protein
MTAQTIAERISLHRKGDYRSGRKDYRIRSLGCSIGPEVSAAHERLGVGGEPTAGYPKGTGAESGPVTLYGYQRGLMDAMCDPRIPLVTVLKAARVGYTRCATLAIAYHLHQDPTLCAIAQPTIPDAEDFGGSEIAPMLRETPVLKGLIRPDQERREAGQGDILQPQQRGLDRVVGAASDDAFRRY